ncbi:MAG TPA: NifU family protein [Pyrinomonadaceae bacterium]|jgi:Fe-S cluster biogenesis protein NfuA|nr:NifU family protein [Pyrinomonadaceae bacterium]
MTDDLHILSDIDSRDPNIRRFTTARTLYVGTRTVNNADDAKGLPLAEKLICLRSVAKIQLIGHLLVVTKTAAREWDDLSKEIESILTSYLISSEALTRDDVEEKMMLMGRSTKEKVQYLIDKQINPGVAEHGGSVGVVDVKGNILYLRLYGGCQGCGAADFTLKQGIESIVKRAVPEIGQIVDLTNHNAGINPYYQRTDLKRAVPN